MAPVEDRRVRTARTPRLHPSPGDTDRLGSRPRTTGRVRGRVPLGVLHGTTYSLIGAALGSTVAFLVARRYGRPYVERGIATDTLSAFDRIVAREGQFALFFVFLVPGLPDDAICFMAGITRLPLWKLVVISAVGRIPGYLLVCYAGSQFATANYLGTTVVLGLMAFASALVYWRKDAVLARIR
ncbi:VTT domain-containing protein [Halogeometricum sp. S1BR25-6]|uniref:VTT domain-containing protein n=1 Tax=Halogeometricum salsisoli TaxID=2950536 RepID=A0ABU2GKY3_9EURY|nr:VTT domain-containing protein [Halogeometricum sp. S1BR25-6]MDS0301056.1 VTT domain-containing protein [Halogeometricum sp. S1BR25-6]